MEVPSRMVSKYDAAFSLFAMEQFLTTPVLTLNPPLALVKAAVWVVTCFDV